jgi:hypothetical protein
MIGCFPAPAARAACVAATLAACACVSAPPASVTVAAGEVRADTPQRAAEVAALLEHHATAIRALLDGTREEPVSVWVQENPRVFHFFEPDEDVSSFTNHGTNRIHLSADPQASSVDLAHELVHLLLDDTWDSLPDTLEEGLADVVADRVAGEGARAVRFMRLASVLALTDAGEWRFVVDLDTQGGGATAEARVVFVDFEPVPPAEVFSAGSRRISPFLGGSAKAALYGLAFVAVAAIEERAGLEGLHRECLRLAQEGGDPASAFAALASLGEEPGPWRDAALGLLRQEDAIAFLAGGHVDLVASIVLLARFGYAGAAADEALDGARPRMILGSTGFEVPLVEVPGFRDAFHTVWSSKTP